MFLRAPTMDSFFERLGSLCRQWRGPLLLSALGTPVYFVRKVVLYFGRIISPSECTEDLILISIMVRIGHG